MKRYLSAFLSVLLVAVMIFAMIPASVSATAEKLATFDFGANGAASHSDGSESTNPTYTIGNYTLSLANTSKVYTGARDAEGNSCLKLGTSKAAGEFTFTVGSDVTQVILYVAQYKDNTTKVSVNGTQYTIDTASNNGSYTPITVDTSSNKTVTFTTVSGGYRCMMDTIEFYGTDSGSQGGGSVTPPAANGIVATFEFGNNGTATHSDGSGMEASASYTDGNYTLNITDAVKVYKNARDAKGNSCIKLGSSSAIGEFKFTVASDVTQVIIYVAKYKNNASTVSINGTEYSISASSNDGNYTAITVDTLSNKTVSFATVASHYRCMINTIEFYASTSGGGATPTPTPTPTPAPTYVSITEARAAADDTEVYTEGTVIFNNGKDVVIYDPVNNVGISLYRPTGTATVGTKVKVKGTRGVFGQLVQLSNGEIISYSDGDTYTHALKTVSQIVADTTFSLESTPVKLTNVEITNIKTEDDGSKTITITDGTKSIDIYKAPALNSGIDEGDTVNINNAVVGRYNSNAQLKVASADDIVFVEDGTVNIDYVDIETALAASGLIGTEGVVIFTDDSNAVIYDGTAGINLFFGNVGHSLSKGDKVKVSGVRGEFRGLQQLTAPTVEDTISTGNTVTYNASTIAAILADTIGDIESTPIILENVVIGEINTSGNTIITDANGNSINIYKIPALTGIEEGDTVTVKAIVSDYNGYQLKVASASDVALVSSGNNQGGNQGSGNQGGGAAETGDTTALIVIAAAVATVTLAGAYFTKKRTLAD